MSDNYNKHPKIDPEMTVLQVVSIYRETESVFKRFDKHIGECICCNYLFETLGMMAQKTDLDLETLIRDLEGAIQKKL